MTLDSIDLTFDTDPLPIVEPSRLWPVTQDRTGRKLWTAGKPELEKLPGLSGIRATAENVSVRLSAKIHGPAYFDGTHLGNVDALADCLNATGFFHGLRADDLLAARCTRADPYTDVLLGSDLPPYVAALHLVSDTGGDRFERKGRRRTPTFYARLNADDLRQRQYGKAADLSKAKNRTLRGIGPELLPAAEETGRWRVELTAPNLPQVRRLAWMASGNPTLADVLNAPGTPVADSLDRTLALWEGITRKPMPLPSLPNSPAAYLDAFAGLSPSEASKRFTVRAILDIAAGNLEAAEGLLRATHGHNWKRTFHPHLVAEIERRNAEAYRLILAPDRDPVTAARSILSRVAGAVRAAA